MLIFDRSPIAKLRYQTSMMKWYESVLSPLNGILHFRDRWNSEPAQRDSFYRRACTSSSNPISFLWQNGSLTMHIRAVSTVSYVLDLRYWFVDILEQVKLQRVNPKLFSHFFGFVQCRWCLAASFLKPPPGKWSRRARMQRPGAC